MLIDIDASLLTPTTAVGRIYGALELAHLPRVGDTVSLPLVASAEWGFSDHLVVEHVIHPVGSSAKPMLSLSDIVANDDAAARSIALGLEQAYGLFFDPYDQT